MKEVFITVKDKEGHIQNFHNHDMVTAVEAKGFGGTPGMRLYFPPNMQSDIKELTPDDYVKALDEWQDNERRQELAKAALIGIMANPETRLTAKQAARRAVCFADALIEELKKGGAE